MSKSDLLPIEKTVETALRDNFPAKSPSLVIGVSGGADSMCLLHILHRLQVDLYVVHINYQKRGAASDKDAALVKKITANLGVDAEIIGVNPDKAESQNFQEWAREVRFKAFKQRAEQVRADGIALAHHQNDQIETILQKIFRAGGLASWSAMETWNGHFFRPLLAITRNEIEQYCRVESISFRDDESNFSSDFARNFLRNEWLPELEQHFPGWQQNVLRVAEQAEIFASSLKFILRKVKDEKDRINRQVFLELDENLQKSVLNYYVNKVDKDAVLSRGVLGELTRLKELQTGKSIPLTEEIELLRDRSYFKLMIDADDSDAFLKLTMDDLKNAGLSFNGISFSIQPFKNPDFEHRLYLDADSVNWPLHIRKWRAGDRFQPLGMEGHQTVADHLTNRKVSAAQKDTALVLESFEETICAVIFPPLENRRPPGTISEMVKCGESTRQCIIIKPIE